MRVLGDDRVDAPDDGEAARRYRGSASGRGPAAAGRSRAIRKAVEPDEVQATIALRSSVSATSRAATAMASAPVASGAGRCA